jgi:5-methylcytosine-specific restriction enzyme subunit McrC
MSETRPTVPMGEWDERRIPGVTPTPDDLALSVELSKNDRRLIVDWLVDGARVRSTSWVGTARFSRFEIRIQPKLAGGSLGVITMLGYGSGLEALSTLPTPLNYDVEAQGLADLWCLVLAREAERILIGGPVFDYVWQESAQPALRGRLMLVEQVARHFGEVDSLECRFEDYLSDILDNQLLLSGLRAGRAIAKHPDLSQRMARLGAALSEYSNPLGIDLESAEQHLVYNRRNEHYRTAHALSLLLLRHLYLRDLYSLGRAPAIAFLLDMNPLFERFATQLVKDAMTDQPINVFPQRRTSSLIVNEATGATYSRVIPDMLLVRKDGHGRLPVDAKYKRYDQRSIDPGDIYQVFLYAYAFQTRDVNIPTAMILFPTETTASAGVRLRVQSISALQSARIATHPLPVPAILDRIRHRNLMASGELSDLQQSLLQAIAA